MKSFDVAALVTGGASGLGEATTRALAGRGAAVTILDLQEDRGQALAAELGGHTTFVRTDVTDEASVQAAIDEATGKDRPLRIAVNCAGIAWAQRTLGRDGELHELGPFTRTVMVNLVGTFNVLRLAAAAMAQTEPGEDGERGVIVNTASIAAYDGQIGQVAYAASKGGIVGLTLPAARDLSSVGVRVCTIAPGLVDSPKVSARWRAEPARVWTGLLVVLGVGLYALDVVAVYPGYLSFDSVQQLGQALDPSTTTDWHPPVMTAVWGLLLEL